MFNPNGLNWAYLTDIAKKLRVGQQVRINRGRFGGSIAEVRAVDVKGLKLRVDILPLRSPQVEINVGDIKKP